MRRVLPILMLLASASCRREEPATKTANTLAPSKQAERRSSLAEPVKPQPLLDTPRVWISSTGNSSSLKAKVATNAAAILADLDTLPPSASRDRVYGSVIAELAVTDPAQARIFLKEWKGLVEPWRNAARKIACELAKSRPTEVRDFITQDVPPGMQIEVWAAYIQTLPTAERPAIIATLPEGSERLHIIGSLTRDWVVTDPAALAAWLDANPPPSESSERQALDALREIFNTAANDPTLWLAAFHSAQNPEAQRFLAEKTLQFASVEQRAQWRIEFAELVPGLKDSSDMRPWQEDPAGWVAKLPEAEVTSMPAEKAENLVRTWAQKNPRRALEWALAHNRPEAAQALDLLYYQEPKEAVAMAPNLPAGPARDEVVITICSVASHFGDHASAQALLPLISDPKRQEFQRKQVAESLAKRKK